jgi:hypothetical protein
MCWAFLFALPLAGFSPVLALIAPGTALLLAGHGRRRAGLASASALSVVLALPFLTGDPGWWLETARRLHVQPGSWWPVAVAIAVVPLFLTDGPTRRVGIAGGLLSLASLMIVRVPFGGPGVEEALLITASLGVALIVAAGADLLAPNPARVGSVALAVALLVLSVGPLMNGRYGLPAGEVNERLGFGAALAGPSGPGRILLASTERNDVPGEAYAGPGFWYRVFDGTGMTNDELWLPEPMSGDRQLETALTSIASGSELRPGELLAAFSIDWVVLDGPTFRMDEVLVAQLDMVPTPLDAEARVFENLAQEPLADAGEEVWVRDGTGFSGPTGSGGVRLSINFDDGWGPEPEQDDWAVTIDGASGAASYDAGLEGLMLPLLTGALVAAALVSILIARSRR